MLCQPARQNADRRSDGANLANGPVAQDAGDFRHAERTALYAFMQERRSHVVPRRHSVVAPLLQDIGHHGFELQRQCRQRAAVLRERRLVVLVRPLRQRGAQRRWPAQKGTLHLHGKRQRPGSHQLHRVGASQVQDQLQAMDWHSGSNASTRLAEKYGSMRCGTPCARAGPCHWVRRHGATPRC